MYGLYMNRETKRTMRGMKRHCVHYIVPTNIIIFRILHIISPAIIGHMKTTITGNTASQHSVYRGQPVEETAAGVCIAALIAVTQDATSLSSRAMKRYSAPLGSLWQIECL